MAKFVIECPSCQSYVRVSNSIFAKKQIRCNCGTLIDIKANRMMSRVCPHCGNSVVFDAAKGEKAKCPVCKERINTTAEQSRTEEFSCSQCGIRLRADKNASHYRCPVCDTDNDVQAQIAKERISRQGVASIIKYEGDNRTFIWKHPIEDFNLGSQLIVHETQEAVFFRNGQALDSLGPGRHTLETQSMPILNKLYKLPTDSVKTFHSEVYFINMTTQMGIKWGTDSKVRVKDPVNGFYVELGAGGEFNLKVSDARRLLMKLVGTVGSLSQSDLLSSELVGGVPKQTGYFRAMIMTQVKTYLAQTIRQENINILDIDEQLSKLSEGLKILINQSLQEYGLVMPEFYVTRIVTPDDDENFIRLRQQFADQVLNVREEEIRQKTAEATRNRKRVEAQTDAEMKIIAAQAEAEARRQNILVEAEEMRLKGYSYQQETARQVGVNATSNLGGSGGSGLSDLMGLGVAMGAMGSIASTTKHAVSGLMDPGESGWTCSCGTVNTGKFCSECGKGKPQNERWVCSCGTENTGKFCSECGKMKPQPAEPWTCVCGETNTGKFCSACGKPKPEGPWTCSCGNSGITGKFCPECGRKKGE